MWLLGVILDNICGFFKVCFSRTLSKQIYRNCAVLMTGTVVVAVLVYSGQFYRRRKESGICCKSLPKCRRSR